MSILLVLPLPPSTNNLWRPIQRGRKSAMIKTAAYSAWKVEAGHTLNIARQTPIKGEYQLVIKIPYKDRADADNRIKAVSDLLVEHGLIPDDRFAVAVHVQRCEDVRAGTCVVTAW